MNRSAQLVRRTPLQRVAMPRGARGLVRSPLTIGGKRSSSWHRSRLWCFDRAQGRCEARVSDDCTGRAEHAHHRLMRSQGGSDDPSNLAALCGACHAFVHLNPAWSYEYGWLLHAPAPDQGGAA